MPTPPMSEAIFMEEPSMSIDPPALIAASILTTPVWPDRSTLPPPAVMAPPVLTKSTPEEVRVPPLVVTGAFTATLPPALRTTPSAPDAETMPPLRSIWRSAVRVRVAFPPNVLFICASAFWIISPSPSYAPPRPPPLPSPSLVSSTTLVPPLR